MKAVVSAPCALLLAALVASPACGGDGFDAPPSAIAPDCPGLDARLAPLYALLDAGALAHLQHAVAVTLPEDARADVVDALLGLLPRFEEGAFEALAGWADAGVADPALATALARGLRWIALDSPAAPYGDALRALRGTLASCEGAGVFALAADLVADDALLAALGDALARGGLAEALGALETDGAEGREALRLLLRNLMVAASSPDFDARVLLDLLGFIVDLDVPPWPPLVDAVLRALAPGPGLDAVQDLLRCVLLVDPEVHLGPLLFDLLTAPEVGLLASLGGDAAGERSLPPELTRVLATALAYLADDAEARRALAAAARVLLRDDVAPGVLVDLAALLDADVLGELLRIVATIASRSCAL